jgi:mono/diheme cytochrome c family protein
MKNIASVFKVAALAVALGVPLSVYAQSPAETLFKSRCAMCHGEDGTGSSIGKKMGAPDLTSVDVQKMSDAELTDVITNGKNKMPAYGKALTSEEIKGLVAYIRTLKK